MAKLNLDRLKRKSKETAEGVSGKKTRLALGSSSGAREKTPPPPVSISPSGQQGGGDAPIGDSARPARFVSLLDDQGLAWSTTLQILKEEEIFKQDNCSNYQLIRDINHDIVRSLTRSAVVAHRLMIAERHMASDEEKINELAAEVEEEKNKTKAAEEQRDAARASENALRAELAQLRKTHATEKVALVQKTLEDYKKSEAFQMELEETFTQAFEVARDRATLLFPELDFSALQPVDPEETTAVTGAAGGREGGEEASSKGPPSAPSA